MFTAAQQHIAYIGVGAVAAVLLYSELAILKNRLISVFEVGGSFFFYPMLSRKAFARNLLK